MAIIYSYPEKTTPAGGDFLVITDSEQSAPNKNRTKSLTIDNLADYVVTSTSGITGSGTLNTIAMFTPNGQAIGDSIITQNSGATRITIGGSLTTGSITAGPITIKNSSSTALTLKSDTFPGGVEYTYLLFYTDPTTSSSSISTPNSGGVVEIGQASGGFVQNLKVNGYNEIDQLRATTIRDGFGSTGSTFTGTNVLTVQNLFGQLQWEDSTDLVSGSISKLIPFQVTASAGGSDDYDRPNNIVEIGWTGGNGTYILNIPSAATIPYRNIRFVTNSTFPNGASDKVRITAQAGETIDGAAFFEISKVYEGVSIWSNGTEWIVIQAKAH
jgi:hypothetical protein